MEICNQAIIHEASERSYLHVAIGLGYCSQVTRMKNLMKSSDPSKLNTLYIIATLLLLYTQ